MNKVLLVGRLTKDVDLRTTQNGKSCAQFSVAVNRRFKDANGNYQADFINCVAWGQTAEFINKHFHKGERIGLAGCIQSRTYEKDGKTVYVVEVIVEEAEFVESKSSGSAPAQTPKSEPPKLEEAVETEDDDSLDGLPFEF